MSRLSNPTACALVLLCGLLPGVVMADGMTAQLDTRKAGLGDSVTLTLTTEDPTANSPDLGPLVQDFDILSTGRSDRTSIINGQRTESRSWKVMLSPKAPGTIEIPGISAGPVSSNPLSLEVVKALAVSGTPNSGFSVMADIGDGPFDLYEEIPLTVRIEAEGDLQSASLNLPQTRDLTLSQTGEDRTTQVMRNGKPVTVIERQYLLRPQKSGTLTLPPFVLDARVPDAAGTGPFGRDPFADMMRNSPFGNSVFAGSPFASMLNPGRPVRAVSDALEIEVRNTPMGEGSADWFLPAKAVELTATWEPAQPTFRVGEPVTRHIRLQALGATAEQLPNIELPRVDGARLYVENSKTRSVDTPNGTAALRETIVSVVPVRGGDVVLPEMSVTWWDTAADMERHAVIPSQTITVEGGAAVAAVTTHAPTTSIVPRIPQEAAKGPLPWYLLAGGALAGVVAFGAILRARRTRSAPRRRNATRAHLAEFRTAWRQRDARVATKAFRRWQTSLAMVEPGPHQSPALPQLVLHAARLDAAAYGRNQAEEWDGHAMIRLMRQAMRHRRHANGLERRFPALPPLYPDPLPTGG